jgi:hypothetical protein
MFAIRARSPRIYKPALAAAAAVLASLALSASAQAYFPGDVTSCTRWTGNTTSTSSIMVNFPYAYSAVTPGTRVYYMLNRWTGSAWQYTGVWNSLTAASNPYSGAGIKWVERDGSGLIGHDVLFYLPHASGYYDVTWYVVANGVTSRTVSVGPYDNFVNTYESGWTSYCQS